MFSKKAMRSDHEVLEEAMLPHLLQVALCNVHKDGEHMIPNQWLKLSGETVRLKFKGLDMLTQRRVAYKLESDSVTLLKMADCTTYTELALTIALLILNLVKEGAYKDTRDQSVYISAKIANEALDYGDWGDLKACKRVSQKLQNHLTFMGYYDIKKAVIH